VKRKSPVGQVSQVLDTLGAYGPGDRVLIRVRDTRQGENPNSTARYFNAPGVIVGQPTNHRRLEVRFDNPKMRGIYIVDRQDVLGPAEGGAT